MIPRALRLFWAYILAHKKIFIIALIGGFLFPLIFSRFVKPYLDTKPKNRIIGRTGNFTLQTIPLDIQEKLSFGLTKTLSDGTATSSAAVDWQATDSGKIYRFTINPNLTWQDGQPFTASDINYQLQDVKIVTLNSSTVEFQLIGPFAPFPVIVSQPIFRPGLVGLGEYRLKSLRQSGRFLESLAIEKLTSIQTYKFYPTDKLAITALRLGKVDTLEKISSVEEGKNLVVSPEIDYTHQAAIFFNTQNNLLAEKTFRQALVYALPQNIWPGVQSFGPLSPFSWAYNTNLKKYPQDVATAKTLLSKTGASQSAKIVLSIIPDLVKPAHLIKEAWEKIGVEVTLETSENIPENYQAILMLFEIPSDPDQYILWHSTSPQNITKYKSPKSDKLLEEGRQSLNQEVRKAKYFEFQKAITEDVPAAFLYFPTVYTVTRK